MHRAATRDRHLTSPQVLPAARALTPFRFGRQCSFVPTTLRVEHCRASMAGMPSPWKTQCEGYVSYRWHENGGIEVQDQGFLTFSGKAAGTIAKFSNRLMPLLEKYSAENGIPVSWLVGIIYVESRGNDWACSPCIKTNSKGVAVCSLAPNKCGGGIARDGKHYSCCAYGLMQLIETNAVDGGMKNGAELLGNPEDSIRLGAKLFARLVKISEGDPLVAVRRYNGCSVCVGGRLTKCTPGCIFGIGGQGGYAESFTMAVNTFLELPPGPVAPPEPPLVEPVDYEASVGSPGVLGLALAIGVGIGAYWYASKRNW